MTGLTVYLVVFWITNGSWIFIVGCELINQDGPLIVNQEYIASSWRDLNSLNFIFKLQAILILLSQPRCSDHVEERSAWLFRKAANRSHRHKRTHNSTTLPSRHSMPSHASTHGSVPFVQFGRPMVIHPEFFTSCKIAPANTKTTAIISPEVRLGHSTNLIFHRRFRAQRLAVLYHESQLCLECGSWSLHKNADTY